MISPRSFDGQLGRRYLGLQREHPLQTLVFFAQGLCYALFFKKNNGSTILDFCNVMYLLMYRLHYNAIPLIKKLCINELSCIPMSSDDKILYE